MGSSRSPDFAVEIDATFRSEATHRDIAVARLGWIDVVESNAAAIASGTLSSSDSCGISICARQEAPSLVVDRMNEDVDSGS